MTDDLATEDLPTEAEPGDPTPEGDEPGDFPTDVVEDEVTE